MRKNMKNILSLIAFVTIIGLIITGCKKEDDGTGYSTLVPVSGVTVTITPDFTSDVDIVEQDSVFTYTVSLNQAQLADVKLVVNVTGGTATAGEDFDYLGVITIPTGSTTASGWIKVMSDDIFEEQETFTIQVGDATTANVSLTPATYNFTLTNYTDGDFLVELSWDGGEVFDVDGDPISATALADMRFLIFDDTFTYLTEFDGSGFEGVNFLSTGPDATYYLAVAFYSVIDLGDQTGSGIDLDFFIDYQQNGIKAGSFVFPAGLNTVANIDNTLFLVSVTKAGNDWTISPFEGFKESDIDFAASTWNGLDGAFFADETYPNEVVTAGTSGAYTIDGLNFGWMLDVWGETVTTSTPVTITFNDDGTLVIPDQYYMTTDYAGSPYDYNISGTGTWNQFLLPVAMVINYEMDQDGFLVANYWSSGTDTFMADLVYGSAKKKSAKTKVVKSRAF
jgi:hypothetical protein